LVSPRFRAITVGSLLSVLTATAVYGQQPRQEQIFELPVPDNQVHLLGAVAVEPKDTKQVVGRITDMHTGKAVCLATISIKGSLYQTETDQDGRFSLAIPKQHQKKPFTVLVSTPGYQEQQRTIIPDQLLTTLHAQLVAHQLPVKEIYQTKGEVQMINGGVRATPQH